MPSFRVSFFAIVILMMISCRDNGIQRKQVDQAQSLFGLNFTDSELDTVISTLERCLSGYEQMREKPLANHVLPAFQFDPRRHGFRLDPGIVSDGIDHLPETTRPSDSDSIAFLSVPQLAYLIQSKQMTSEELVVIYLDRFERYDSILQSAITLTRDTALAQAKRADNEIANGIYRGPLHGIPYGVKDLASTRGYPTTWGAEPYRNQIISEDATIVKKLRDAGAVLIAKLSSGELANGDTWFGGVTKNPWDTEQGASGSSAGPGSATAAGLVGFSIGTETWGSILSPSARCGLTGLRPTFGRVSRHGVMALAWTLDKIGPMCRTSSGCHLVFNAINGVDPMDPTTSDLPFYDPNLVDISNIRVGYLKSVFDHDTTDQSRNGQLALETLRSEVLQLTPDSLPADLPWNDLMYYVIRGEASAAFDDLMHQNRDDLLTRKTRFSRANSLRAGEFIPAVAYIQANRHRTVLMEKIDNLFQKYDLIIALSRGSEQSAMTNLTGHPALTLPTGFDQTGRPTSIVLIAPLYREDILLAVASKYQALTDHEALIPPELN